MRKVLSFGKIAYTGMRRSYLVTVEIELSQENTDKPVFTASANVWDTRQTDIVMGGQCLGTIWNEYGSQISNPDLYKKILGLWQRNHLNDLNAGCEHQREQKWGNDKIGVYEYGTAWLYRPISESDLQEIRALLN